MVSDFYYILSHNWWQLLIQVLSLTLLSYPIQKNIPTISTVQKLFIIILQVFEANTTYIRKQL